MSVVLRLLDWFYKLIVGATLPAIGFVLAESALDRFTWETNPFTVERNQNPLSSLVDKRLIMMVHPAWCFSVEKRSSTKYTRTWSCHLPRLAGRTTSHITIALKSFHLPRLDDRTSSHRYIAMKSLVSPSPKPQEKKEEF
jgi:hypothetical protein